MVALLAQFPPSFKNNKEAQRTIRAIIQTFKHYPLVVELRDKSWSDDPATAKLLAQYNVCWARLDEPRFGHSIAIDLPQTADIAYFRFHGRNKKMWWHGDNETRYRYLYSPGEITELAQRVESATAQTKLTFVLFNNHWKGYAPRNAIQMIHQLGGQVDVDLPATFAEEEL